MTFPLVKVGMDTQTRGEALAPGRCRHVTDVRRRTLGLVHLVAKMSWMRARMPALGGWATSIGGGEGTQSSTSSMGVSI